MSIAFRMPDVTACVPALSRFSLPVHARVRSATQFVGLKARVGRFAERVTPGPPKVTMSKTDTIEKKYTYVGRILHRRPPRRNLSRVALDKRRVNGIGERKLGQVLGDVLLHLVLLEAGGLAEGLGGDDGGHSGLIRDGREVLVGDDADLGDELAVLFGQVMASRDPSFCKVSARTPVSADMIHSSTRCILHQAGGWAGTW